MSQIFFKLKLLCPLKKKNRPLSFLNMPVSMATKKIYFNLILLFFSEKKSSIYSGSTDKPLSEIKVMVIIHKSISQVLSAANKKVLLIGAFRQHVTLTCTL